MNLSAAHPETERRGVSVSKLDRLFPAFIIGSGALVFVLLAWAHLGLGALLAPPAATAQRQVTTAGPYQIALVADSGQLTARGPNKLSFELRDRLGQPISDAVIEAHPVMTTMAMESADIRLKSQGEGRYLTQPKFVMAGDWRLDLMITRPGATTQHASFVVSVRWN